MSFFAERQPFLVEKKNEIDAAMQCIADSFNINWLKKDGDHPLQILWQRKDTLAGSELYFFGECLLRVTGLDRGWAKNNINRIKIGNPNERIGFIFEVICLGMLEPFFRTTPAPRNRAGYDGIIELENNKKIRLSIKSYGLSSHYKEFQFHSRKVEELFKSCIRNNNIVSSSLFVDCDEFISSGKWKYINEQILSIAEQYDGRLISSENNNSIIGIMPLNNPDAFFPELNSYHVLLMGKFHDNEKKNLFDKLDEAYYNLNKHSGTEDDEYRNVVFIHLPPNASIHECSQWTYDYYAEHPEKQISGVFFYQPLVAREQGTNYPFINHFVVGVMNGEKFNEWNTNKIPLQFNIPVGSFTNQIAVQKIMSIRNKLMASVDIPDRYLYQKGNYYFKSVMQEDSFSAEVNLDNIASGIISHSVVQFRPNSAFMILTPQSHPTDELILL